MVPFATKHVLAISTALVILFITPGRVITAPSSLNLGQYCEECMSWGGAPFFQHPTACRKYIHCLPGANKSMTGLEMICPETLFWSQVDLTCLPEEDVDCKNDKCRHGNQMSYSDGSSCNGFFRCTSRRTSVPACCDLGRSYDDDLQACIRDVSCTAVCGQQIAKEVQQTAPPPICDSYDADDSRFYLRDTGNGFRVRMPCAPGTIFSKYTCSCSEYDTSYFVDTSCQPYFHFPFDDNFNDKTGNKVSSGIRGVELRPVAGAKGGVAAYFDGTSKITIWALNNMDFGSTFVLNFHFKAEGSGSKSRPTAIMDNSDCKKNATFGVALVTNGISGTLYGGFMLQDGSTVTRNIANIPMSNWHDVTLIKSGKSVQVRVDNTIVTARVEGNIKRNPCSMTLGEGTGLNNFVGYIDEVRFYKCYPDELKSGMFSAFASKDTEEVKENDQETELKLKINEKAEK